MRTTSLVSAKAHLSELVDRAERGNEATMICRRGRPAAVIVPVGLATAVVRGETGGRLSPEDAVALLDRMARREQPAMSLDEALGRTRFG